jgi:hypothetical protein
MFIGLSVNYPDRVIFPNLLNKITISSIIFLQLMQINISNRLILRIIEWRHMRELIGDGVYSGEAADGRIISPRPVIIPIQPQVSSSNQLQCAVTKITVFVIFVTAHCYCPLLLLTNCTK